MVEPDCPYVSRGGLKLAAALDAFGIDPTGFVCADLGCSVGGFTDCLLQRGAAHVYAVDTAYGDLAWPLRQDARVSVLERTNALHLAPRSAIEGFAGCDLVTLDLGWTRQAKAIPAALRWLRREGEGEGRIITLVKPHYEQPQPARGGAVKSSGGGGRGPRGASGKAGKAPPMGEQAAAGVVERVLAALLEIGVEPLDRLRSPITGSKGGNVEYLALLRAGRC